MMTMVASTVTRQPRQQGSGIISGIAAQSNLMRCASE